MGWHPGCWVVHVKLTIALRVCAACLVKFHFLIGWGMGHNDVTVNSPEKIPKL